MMSNKATSGKRQDELTVQTIRKTVRVFIKMAVDHLVNERCTNRIKELTGVDLRFRVVPSPLLHRCCRRAMAGFYSKSEDVTTSMDLMESLACWTFHDLPGLIDKELSAPGADILIWRHIARQFQALVFQIQNVALLSKSLAQSAPASIRELSSGHDATSDAA